MMSFTLLGSRFSVRVQVRGSYEAHGEPRTPNPEPEPNLNSEPNVNVNTN